MSDPKSPGPDFNLPMASAPAPVLLPADPSEATAALQEALEQPQPGPAVRAVAARWPTLVEVWARLGEQAYQAGQDIEAFAFFRTAYHRGLDRLRQNGWRGIGYVPWSHAPNQGVLRAILGLMHASSALGESDEARRCRQLLLDSDPGDPFKVGDLQPSELDARIEPRFESVR
jgi:tetratricopeptide (TPR) repeat protein